MKALLEEKLGSWHRQPSEPDQVPAVPNTPIPQFAPGADTVYLVDRPGLTQASGLAYSTNVTAPYRLMRRCLCSSKSGRHLCSMAVHHRDGSLTTPAYAALLARAPCQLSSSKSAMARCLSANLGCVQASVGMGELGISLGDPDDWALDVLGDILNSFGGRLFDRIRSREVCKHFQGVHFIDWVGQTLCTLACLMRISQAKTKRER